MNRVPVRVPHFFPFAITAIAALTLLAGCQRTEDRLADAAIERAARGQVEVDRGSGQVTLRSADGHVAMRAGESLPLPGDFPDDIYLPRDYAVNSVMDLQGVSMVSLSAPGQVPALFAAARDAMQAQGWKQTLAAQHSVDAAMLAFEKGAGSELRSATLSFNRNNGDERVIVGVQLRQPQSP